MVPETIAELRRLSIALSREAMMPLAFQGAGY